MPLRLNPRVSTLRAVYKAHIDVVHVQVEGGGASSLLAGGSGAATAAAAAAAAASAAAAAAAADGGDPAAVAAAAAAAAAAASAAPTTTADGISESAEDASARVARLRALAATPDLYERLMASVAPSIWQLDDVKAVRSRSSSAAAPRPSPGAGAAGRSTCCLSGTPASPNRSW